MANLRTDYVDDELDVSVNENRRYRMIDNGDGTVSFEDVTEYLQQGDNYGSAEVNEQNETINQINVDLTAKVSKSGDTINGNLTVKGYLTSQQDSAACILLDMNGDTERRRAWIGMANGGTFYIYDNTKNRAIIEYPLAYNIPVFHGMIGAEPLTVVSATASIDNFVYWAYKFGNWVYVNIRCRFTEAFPAQTPLFWIKDSSGNDVLPSIDRTNSSYSQLLSGTKEPATTRYQDGRSIMFNYAVASGEFVHAFGMFMVD